MTTETKKPRRKINIPKGTVYGELTMMEEMRIDGHRCGLFVCNCGEKVVSRLFTVVSGKQKSCGCLLSKVTSARNLAKGRKPGTVSVMQPPKKQYEPPHVITDDIGFFASPFSFPLSHLNAK